MEVQAQKEVFDYHLQRLGNYTRMGDFNGYPYYQLDQYNVTNYLYYRKDGKLNFFQKPKTDLVMESLDTNLMLHGNSRVIQN